MKTSFTTPLLLAPVLTKLPYSLHSSFLCFRLCRGCSLLWCVGFSLWWLLLLQSTGLQASVMAACGSILGACRLWSSGSLVAVHVLSCSMAGGIFPGQGSNPCLCIGRWALYHGATREAHCPKFWCSQPLCCRNTCLFITLSNATQLCRNSYFMRCFSNLSH